MLNADLCDFTETQAKVEICRDHAFSGQGKVSGLGAGEDVERGRGCSATARVEVAQAADCSHTCRI